MFREWVRFVIETNLECFAALAMAAEIESHVTNFDRSIFMSWWLEPPTLSQVSIRGDPVPRPSLLEEQEEQYLYRWK